jgi:hypothetical protein
MRGFNPFGVGSGIRCHRQLTDWTDTLLIRRTARARVRARVTVHKGEPVQSVHGCEARAEASSLMAASPLGPRY